MRALRYVASPVQASLMPFVARFFGGMLGNLTDDFDSDIDIDSDIEIRYPMLDTRWSKLPSVPSDLHLERKTV